MREPGPEQESRTRSVPSGEAGRVLRFSSLAPGALFAERYEIVASLGAGGSGEVFRAHDRVAGHAVALKVLFPRAGADEHRLTRPRRELGILRGLSHPGIVRVFDMGEHDGLTYLVMELLEGETLRERIVRCGRLDEGAALEVLRGALEALAAAHDAGVVHRDVKPGNVFLAGAAEGEERVVLLDFGLARRSMDATLTETGAFLGTPEYVSPEQARGAEGIGPASDLYSLGVSIWEALAGRTPFEGVSQMEVLRLKMQDASPFAKSGPRGVSRTLRIFLHCLLGAKLSERPADAARALALWSELQSGGWKGWMAGFAKGQSRLRPRTRRIVALAIVAVALLALGIFPWRARLEGDGVSLRGVLGHEVGRVTLPFGRRAITSYSPDAAWSRFHLVAVGRDARHVSVPEEGPLFRLDVLRRTLVPLRLVHAARPEPYRLVSGFERYDDKMGDVRLQTLRERHPDTGEKLFLVGLQHSGHFPNLTLVVAESGTVHLRGWHAGDVKQWIPTGRQSKALERGVSAVGRAISNALSSRTVLLALPSLAGHESSLFETPPYPRRGVTNGGEVPYYLFFSTPAVSVILSVEGDLGVLVAGGRRLCEFDLSTGIPVSPEFRKGLSAAEWLRRHEELLGLLARAAMANGEGARRIAAELESFARDSSTPDPERGVAYARAAELFRLLGEYERALANARAARELEPELVGHARLDVDLTFRARGFEALRARHLEQPSKASNTAVVHEATLMAALLSSSRIPELRGTLQPWIDAMDGADASSDSLEGGGYFAVLPKRWLMLHFEPRTPLAEMPRDDRFYPDRYPEHAFVLALKLLTIDEPDPVSAHRYIKDHETQFGGGALAPIVPLRAYLAAMGQGKAPTREEVDAALEAQREAGREDLRSLYWVPWADALAAGAARAQGDIERYQRLRARAEAAPGAGPWLEALLSD